MQEIVTSVQPDVSSVHLTTTVSDVSMDLWKSVESVKNAIQPVWSAQLTMSPNVQLAGRD